MWTLNDLHHKSRPPNSDGLVHHVTPETAKWDYTFFDVYKLKPGQAISRTNDGLEICAVVISGAARFTTDGLATQETDHRHGPFDRKPWAMYVPLDQSWDVTAVTDLEIAICGSVAENKKTPFVIAPGDRSVETRGKGNNIRHVIDLLPADRDLADRLLVVEAITPPGCSSSYPPHKHDQDNIPHESQLEEVYYYHIRPEQGFAFQRVYTDDRSLDVTASPENGDVMLVPKGYHPVSAPHGYELFYLNVMAGPKRAWHTTTAAEHVWLLDT
ncbi:5-deoxy-glucuronate isomerase [Shimia sp.]|uniref:5-deoxy-glucuronate isomerase n=1 Tax=Shimia sp. TaxID=1954381 RepID=UPI003297F0C5